MRSPKRPTCPAAPPKPYPGRLGDGQCLAGRLNGSGCRLTELRVNMHCGLFGESRLTGRDALVQASGPFEMGPLPPGTAAWPRIS
jgi:hypothetical protein